VLCASATCGRRHVHTCEGVASRLAACGSCRHPLTT
jgi:hypothetical protein